MPRVSDIMRSGTTCQGGRFRCPDVAPALPRREQAVVENKPDGPVHQVARTGTNGPARRVSGLDCAGARAPGDRQRTQELRPDRPVPDAPEEPNPARYRQ